MGLSDRKKKILQIVVDDYIRTAVPVSSKQITSKYLTDISSATVRSELSALEELGYLSQPHTSAGRIPSSKAYKLYVTELMQKDKELTISDILQPIQTFKATEKIDDVFRKMQKKHHSFGIVKEKGKLLGIVTMEDAIEEIVGNIYDEYD